MVFSSGSSKRRVLPLHVQVEGTDQGDGGPSSSSSCSSSSSSTPMGLSAAERSLVPPKSPLHGARSRIITTANGANGTAIHSTGGGDSGGQRRMNPPSMGMGGGFDRLLMLRNLNSVDQKDGGANGGGRRGGGGQEDEISAAHNLKERKQMEAKRRAEVVLMTKEDYMNTPEGDARLHRQEERMRMQEEELRMQRILQNEKNEKRSAALKRQQEEEEKLKEMYLQKRIQAQQDQERIAQEKDAKRKQALEERMKVLKEEADRKAREEYAARQRIVAEELRAEQEEKLQAMETARMHVEDVFSVAMRVEWLVEEERRKQIEAEAKEWAVYEAREAQRQLEETQRRREAQKDQYEQDRQRRMQIHKLHQERERAAAEKKRRAEQKQQQQQEGGDGGQRGGEMAEAAPLLRQSTVRAVVVVAEEPSPPPLPTPTPTEKEGKVEKTARTEALVPPPQAQLAGQVVEEAPLKQLPAQEPPPMVEVEEVAEEVAGVAEVEEVAEEVVEEVEVKVLSAVSSSNEAVSVEDPPATVSVSVPDQTEVTESCEAVGGPEVVLQQVEEDPPQEDPPAPSPLSQVDTTAIAEQQPPEVAPTLDLPSSGAGAGGGASSFPTLLSLQALRRTGKLVPMAQVLHVAPLSPAMAAGLYANDLIVAFDGITSATPKCLTQIATCVQNKVNTPIPLVVLRRRAMAEEEGAMEEGMQALEEQEEEEDMVQQWQLELMPRKWKGKGLLGCQLSPFKWAPSESESESESTSPATAATDATTEATEACSCEALVLYDVINGSIAHQMGIQNGDVLAKCGDLDLASYGNGDGGDPVDLVEVVSEYIQHNWRNAKHETLALAIQRWDPQSQSYSLLQLTLPRVSEESESDTDPPQKILGCALTTYTQYYYPARDTTTGSIGCCGDCYYTSLASSLHAAALYGHLPCLHALLSMCLSSTTTNSDQLLDWRDDEGRSPLFYACYASQTSSVQCLLSYLVEQPSLRTYDHHTGADIYGDSPLHAACSSGALEIVGLLFESSFITNIHLPNVISQATCAHVAANAQMLKMLQDQYDADLLAMDGDGRMPLFYACLRHDLESVQFLCARNPDFADYADTAGGNTPLHMAAWCGYKDIVEELLKWVPSIALFMPNQDELDPRSLAQRSGWHEIVELLDQWSSSHS